MTEVEEVCPGAYLLRGFLSPVRQRRLATFCLALGQRPAGFYVPVLRTGARMRLEMMCLGRHWNAKTYRYEPVRSDVDGLLVQPLPAALSSMAARAATAARMPLAADVALINMYAAVGRLGVHQDKDERPETLAAGIPVVSFSLGDTATFLFGGTTRRAPLLKIPLYSGDAFVFGGQARLAYHGIARVLPATGPPDLGFSGRLNITFRQFAITGNGYQRVERASSGPAGGRTLADQHPSQSGLPDDASAAVQPCLGFGLYTFSSGNGRGRSRPRRRATDDCLGES
jgi:alkylated DNA repair protein (DNA oxidative demethylase)